MRTGGEAKTKLAELRELQAKAQTPAEIKFVNEQSKRYFDALKDGKEDDVYNFLSQKKQLERLSKLEITKAEDAAEVLKSAMQFKHKDLTKEDIDFYINKQYPIPAKPHQKEDESDDEYKETLSLWQQQVSQAERAMIIEAKLARPELAKYQSELVLPDINKSETSTPAQPTQEELEQAKAIQEEYLKSVQQGLSELKDFKSVFKDEAVEIPIAYEVTNEEKAAIKPILESLHTDFGYFHQRWSNSDGSINAAKLAADIHLLENQEKIFKKLVNESGTQRLAKKIKEDSNIQLDTGTGSKTFVPDSASAEENFLKQVWS